MPRSQHLSGCYAAALPGCTPTCATSGKAARCDNARRWDVFETEGVCPVYCVENGRQNALDYAQQSMGYGRCDLQVLNERLERCREITNEDLKPVV